MRARPISTKQKVSPSGKVLARAFARQKKEVSRGVLQRVFAESGLERASREDTGAWFKKTVIDAFKKWHTHKDGSIPQARVVGTEDFSSSQSGLEKTLGSVVQQSGTASGGKYDIKKIDTGAGPSGGVSYKLEDGKGGDSAVKYTQAGQGVNYKSTGAASYQQHSATSYSKDSGANVQCACGMVAHAGMQNDGKIGFSAIGNTNNSSTNSSYKTGELQSGSSMYQSGGNRVNYTA